MTIAIEAIFRDLGVILTNDHFVYTSGRHGGIYVNKDRLYPHTQQVRAVCAALAEPWRRRGIEVVAGPTIGGVILAQWVAEALSEAGGAPVFAVYAEPRSDADGQVSRYFGRGYDALVRGRQVLIVEDILTTGGSVAQVVAAVRVAAGTPVAIRALCNRGGVSADAVGGVPISALMDVALESWAPEDCPLCQRGIPINTQIGKGGK